MSSPTSHDAVLEFSFGRGRMQQADLGLVVGRCQAGWPHPETPTNNPITRRYTLMILISVPPITGQL